MPMAKGRPRTEEDEAQTLESRAALRCVGAAFVEMVDREPGQTKRSRDCGGWVHIASHLKPGSEPSFPPIVTLARIGVTWHAMAVIDDRRGPSYAEARDMETACRLAVSRAKAKPMPQRKAWEGAGDDSRAAWTMDRNRDGKTLKERRRLATGVDA